MNPDQLRAMQKQIEEIEKHRRLVDPFGDRWRLRAQMEEIERRRHLVDPFGDRWRQIQEIEKHRRLVDPFGDRWRQIDAAGRHDLLRRRIEDATFARLLPELSALKFGTAEWGTAAHAAANRLQSSISSVEEKLRTIPGGINQAEVWKRQLSGVLNDRFRPSVIPQALNAGAVWHGEIERLANIVESHRLHIWFHDLASTLLRPSEYFTGYALRVTERLNDTENEDDRAILRGALALAEEEFSDVVSLTESLIPSESDIEIIEPGPPVIYTLYEEQEEELVRLGRKDGSSQIESASASVDEMRTRDVPHMSANVLLLIAICNQESRIRGGKDIFPPTNAALAAGILPLLVVRDEEGLRSFLTHLYKLIYEGAGDKYPRFLKENGGHLERGDCDVIWSLKDLRNKHSLHDPEHGSESDIRKKYSELGATLRRLGLKGMPVAKEDFLMLQERILSQMIDFLLLLIDKMRAETGE